MSVFEDVKNIALEELATKGYAPNPADVHGIAARVEMMVAHLVEEAEAKLKAVVEKAKPAQPAQPVQGQANPPTP